MRELSRELRADVIATDAPFAIADKPLGARRGRGHMVAPTAYHVPSEWDRDLDPAWCRAACEMAPVVAWFGSWKRRGDIESAMPHPIRCEIVWAKDTHVGPPCPAAMRDERIWIFSRDTFAGQHFETTVWEEPIIPTWERRYHKNQKPERLMGRLLRWAAPPEAQIGDPFMGSGTTLVAAKALGRRAWGIDLNEEHCRVAVARLRAAPGPETAGLPLFQGVRHA
ncbi:MAG TPA: site-specific DNA-methyltransferase [Usitatibacter sp.]|nr:site-specific DNA-methyltransferase [Usitatibacter sp.]